MVLGMSTTAGDNVRVLIWNIQRGSNDFKNGPEKALAVIKAANPDICLLQESYDIKDDRPQLGVWMAKELGWNAWQSTSPHLCVLTKAKPTKTYFHANWHGLGVDIEDRQKRKFTAYTIWLDSGAYISDFLKDNPAANRETLLKCETTDSKRLVQAQALLAHLKEQGHLNSTNSVLVGGDWNCPSHLDWTPETSRAFPFRRALPLPVSLAMRDSGFTDLFRVTYPDPVKVPANTWSPLYRADENGLALPIDRIDRLYAKNPEKGWTLVPVAARLLPDPLEDNNIPDSDRQFPSDHSAVVFDLKWVQKR